MKLLAPTPPAELPAETLLVRLRYRRAAINLAASQNSEPPSAEVFSWVYNRLNRQLRQRLEKFSVLQAKQRENGWRIVSCEELLEHQLMVDNKPFTIRGKIDRVDQHEITGKVAVWGALLSAHRY